MMESSGGVGMGEKLISLSLEDARKAMVWLDVLADRNPGGLEGARKLARHIGDKLDAARGVEKTEV